MTWEKVGRNVNAEGTTTTYQLAGTQLYVQSRKRHIPHASGKVAAAGCQGIRREAAEI